MSDPLGIMLLTLNFAAWAALLICIYIDGFDRRPEDEVFKDDA